MSSNAHDGPPEEGDAWVAVDDPGMVPRYHVYPLDDLREHKTDDHTSCWCKPVMDEEGIIVHNSMDGREKFETGERKMS